MTTHDDPDLRPRGRSLVVDDGPIDPSTAEPTGPTGGPLRRFVRGRPTDPRVGAARAARRCWSGTLGAVPLGPLGQRLGQRLLLGGRAGRFDELEGVLLRLVRRRQHDHRRQAAACRCGRWRCRCRLFGLSSWSILVPQALMGVGHGRRRSTPRCAGGSRPAPASSPALTVALTPVAALMFRFNNPDALLTLLMALAAYAALRAIEEDRFRWYVAHRRGRRVRLPDQAAPGLPGRPRVRAWRCSSPGRAASATDPRPAASPGSPSSSRPGGGSPSSSSCRRRHGPTSAGRRTTASSSSPSATTASAASPATSPAGSADCGGGTRRARVAAGGGLGSMFGGTKGIGRMFDGVIGGQIAWLIPAGAHRPRGRPRAPGPTHRGPTCPGPRSSSGGRGSSSPALVFSFMSGVFHEYYTVALAPAVGALVGIGGATWWRHRANWAAMVTAAVGVAGTTWWARELLGRAPDWNSWLTPLVTVIGVVAAIGLLAGGDPRCDGPAAPAPRSPPRSAPSRPSPSSPGRPRGPSRPSSPPTIGSIVTAGPTVAGGTGPGGFARRRPAARSPTSPAAQIPDFPGGQIPDFAGWADPGLRRWADPGLRRWAGGAGGGVPGIGNAARPSDQVLELLQQDADQYTWVAATMGSTAAAPYQLATQRAVMPARRVQLRRPVPDPRAVPAGCRRQEDPLVHRWGRLRWRRLRGWPVPAVVTRPTQVPAGAGAEAGQTPNVATTEAQKISTWVSQNFASTTVDGVTLYDLTATPTPQ